MEEGFALEKGVLAVTVNLDAANEAQFERACDELIKSPENDLVIDMSAIKFIYSPCLGEIFYAYYEAQKAKKSLSIRVPRALEEIFSLANVEKLIKVEVV